MTWRGVLAGMLALAGLHALVSRAESADRAGQLLRSASGIVRRFLDPAVPAIPDRREQAPTEPAISTAARLPQTRPRPPKQPTAANV